MNKRILAAALAFASAGAFAQTTFASLNDITTGYTQNFDSLGTATLNNVGTASAAGVANSFNLGTGVNSALNGLFVVQTGLTGTTAGSSAPTRNIVSSTGSNASGGPQNYAAVPATDTDRALGTLASGTSGQVFTALRVRNNTGAAISLFGFDFDIEVYRNPNGPTAVPNTLAFDYRLLASTVDDAALIALLDDTTGFTNANISSSVNGVTGSSNDFTGAVSATIVQDGNANRTTFRSEIDLGKAELFLAPGEDIVFRFTDNNDAGNDGGFGIDNVRAVPEPATMAAMALGLGALAARRRRKSA